MNASINMIYIWILILMTQYFPIRIKIEIVYADLLKSFTSIIKCEDGRRRITRSTRYKSNCEL